MKAPSKLIANAAQVASQDRWSGLPYRKHARPDADNGMRHGAFQQAVGNLAVQRRFDSGDLQANHSNNEFGPIREHAADRVADEDASESVEENGQLSIAQPSYRISRPFSPGWATVIPHYLFTIAGEPVELPHFVALKAKGENPDDKKVNVEVLEGRYKDKEVDVGWYAISQYASPSPGAKVTFDATKEELWYGTTGPLRATIDADDPIPRGTHDIEIPDFQHDGGAKYGDFGTTWFRIGHSGDRYIHPGLQSKGCLTCLIHKEWPSIYAYLISRRKSDDRSVGELHVT